MKTRSSFKKTICVLFFSISIAVLCAQAETILYTLENVILDDGTQMTGIFSWVYTPGDFENGIGTFHSLSIPWTTHDQDDLIATIEPSQIEITFDGNVHGDGVDIKLVLEELLMPGASSLINTNHTESKYSIGGDKFHDGFFLGGSISPVEIILSMPEASSNQITFAWALDVPGLVLQQNPNLLSTNWVNAASGTTNPAVISTTAPTMFYRVVMP